MNALEDALNAVYKIKESRALWKTYGIIVEVAGVQLIHDNRRFYGKWTDHYGRPEFHGDGFV
jgi:hypothetical protein